MTQPYARRRLARLMAAAAVSGLALTACSGGAQEAQSPSAAPSSSAVTPSAPQSSDATSPAAPSPGGGEEILAVLCDRATNEQVEAIEATLDPDFTVSGLVDVRTDEDGKHALLGYVEGPGLAVLAQWTGTGLTLEGLSAADEFAARVTELPQATPDEEFSELLGQTVTCYSELNAPEDGDDQKKDDENAE